MIERDDPFLDLGYTSPEEAIALRAKAPRPRQRAPRTAPHIDHPEASTGVNWQDVSSEQQMTNEIGFAMLRPIREELARQAIDRAAMGDATLAAALTRAREERKRQ